MKNDNTSPSMAAVPTYLSASSSSASSPDDSGGPVFYTPPHHADSSARQQQQQQQSPQLIHWKSVHHETCVRYTTLTASLAQVVQDDHATIDILPFRSDVTLWNNDNNNDALSFSLLQRLEKAVAPQLKPSFSFTSPTKKSTTTAAAAVSAATESSTTTTSIFSSPPAKLLQRVVWTTASLVATPISYALASVTAAPTSDYDDPPPNVHYDDDDDFLYENSNDDDDDDKVGSSSKKDMNETKKSSNQPTTTTAASLEVGMKQPIVDVDLALKCLVFLYQAMSTSPERILTLPDENKKSSAASALQQQPNDWQHWIRNVSDNPASEAVVAAAKESDDDIGAVLSDLPMEQTLFLLTILQKFQACQVIPRQPKDVNLVVLPEMAGGGALDNNTKEGDHQASTALQTRITLFDLDCQLQRLERFMIEYNARIDHYTQQAARHKKLGRPKEAMNCLRHRKLLQHQVELYQNQSLNLESIQLAVTHSADTNTVFQTFQQAARALKEMRESSSTSSSSATIIQNVDDVLYDLEEELDWQHQIRATTTSAQSASSLTGIYVDDDDLLNELAQLVDEEVVDNVRPNATSTNIASSGDGGHAHSLTTATTTTTGSLDSPSTTATTTPKPTSTDDIAEQFQQQLQVT
jgi:hypothetical protein